MKPMPRNPADRPATEPRTDEGWAAAMKAYPERSMRAEVARAAFAWGFAAGRDRAEAAQGAVPRAEGLREAKALLREWSKWAHEEAPTSDQDAIAYIVDSDILTDKTDAFLASGPSDERVPEPEETDG